MKPSHKTVRLLELSKEYQETLRKKEKEDKRLSKFRNLSHLLIVPQRFPYTLEIKWEQNTPPHKKGSLLLSEIKDIEAFVNAIKNKKLSNTIVEERKAKIAKLLNKVGKSLTVEEVLNNSKQLDEEKYMLNLIEHQQKLRETALKWVLRNDSTLTFTLNYRRMEEPETFSNDTVKGVVDWLSGDGVYLAHNKYNEELDLLNKKIEQIISIKEEY